MHSINRFWFEAHVRLQYALDDRLVLQTDVVVVVIVILIVSSPSSDICLNNSVSSLKRTSKYEGKPILKVNNRQTEILLSRVGYACDVYCVAFSFDFEITIFQLD